MPPNPDALARALCSLEGLSVGDAFGEQFFVLPDRALDLIEQRVVPAPEWPYTDDTEMALSIAAVLAKSGGIDPDELALSFGLHYDRRRGYGSAMHNFLPQLRYGGDWRRLAPALFGGSGSFGNGAAMRVSPVGGYFADDLDVAVRHATLSAEVTHAHPEAVAGTIAVAVAAGLAWQWGRDGRAPDAPAFIDAVLPFVPDSAVCEGVRHARDMGSSASVMLAMSALGNGSQISAQDTVPFVLWCAAKCLDNYEEALWLTVSGLGDRDTTCAMVGGIVSLYTGVDGIPALWQASREPLPTWPLHKQNEPT